MGPYIHRVYRADLPPIERRWVPESVQPCLEQRRALGVGGVGRRHVLAPLGLAHLAVAVPVVRVGTQRGSGYKQTGSYYLTTIPENHPIIQDDFALL